MMAWSPTPRASVWGQEMEFLQLGHMEVEICDRRMELLSLVLQLLALVPGMRRREIAVVAMSHVLKFDGFLLVIFLLVH